MIEKGDESDMEMTDERFTIENERTVCDNIKNQNYVCSWKSDAESLCRLLNMLYTELMSLRKDNIIFKLIVNEIVRDMQEYVDDDQLVYINQSYVDWIKNELDLEY